LLADFNLNCVTKIILLAIAVTYKAAPMVNEIF
jgi:hypothetical protein